MTVPMRYSPSPYVCPHCQRPLLAQATRRADLFCMAGCQTTVTILDDGQVQYTAPGIPTEIYQATLAALLPARAAGDR